MENDNQQHRTPVTHTEKMAQYQAEIDEGLRETNVMLRDLFIKHKDGSGVDRKMFKDHEMLFFWTRKNLNDKKLCTVCFNPEFHEGIFPIFIGKRIKFHDKGYWGEGHFHNKEFIIRSVISNNEEGLTLYITKPNIIDRLFRRQKTYTYVI